MSGMSSPAPARSPRTTPPRARRTSPRQPTRPPARHQRHSVERAGGVKAGAAAERSDGSLDAPEHSATIPSVGLRDSSRSIPAQRRLQLRFARHALRPNTINNPTTTHDAHPALFAPPLANPQPSTGSGRTGGGGIVTEGGFPSRRSMVSFTSSAGRHSGGARQRCRSPSPRPGRAARPSRPASRLDPEWPRHPHVTARAPHFTTTSFIQVTSSGIAVGVNRCFQSWSVSRSKSLVTCSWYVDTTPAYARGPMQVSTVTTIRRG
jgi:hypothetical protein